MQTYAEQLRQIRDSLTIENWIKGSYFSNKNDTVCMCVHGAAQALVNPQVKKVFKEDNLDNIVSRVEPDAHVGAALVEAKKAVADSKYQDLLTVWKSRPAYLKAERMHNGVSNGFVNLHYLMGMFGITTSFNDSPYTTLEMLKDKLSEAAKWAEENEEFLRNN